MKHPLTILIDMDDVLQSLVKAWTCELNNLYGTNVTENDITSWDIAKFFPNLTKTQIFAPLNNSNFWSDNVRSVDGATKILKQIIDDGHIVNIVTASYYKTLPEKISNFLNMFPYLKWENIIIATNKNNVIGDVIIDDGLHNLINSPCPYKLLFNRPHNQDFDTNTENKIIRVNSWNDIYKFISELD